MTNETTPCLDHPGLEHPQAPGQRIPKSDRTTLSTEALAEIQRLAGAYPDKLAATLPALYVAQADLGFTSLDAMKEVARALEIPYTHVYGVATFYTMYQKKRVGKFHLQVCTNICCALRGGDAIFKRLCERLGIETGQVSPDGLWSVEEVECLGSCGSGPCMQVNSQVYDEFLTDQSLDAILEMCKKGEIPAWGEAEKGEWGKGGDRA